MSSVEAIDAVVEHDGPERARQILTRVVEQTQSAGSGPIASLTTPYVNTIPADREAKLPGDPAIEHRLRSIIRWNAIAMVVRANRVSSELGGHIASYQSLATLYEVGFNHFWHAPSTENGGDLVYFQGHSSPGNYARAFLEGRLSAEQLDAFRQEVSKPEGLSSYPHPWLMPEFWQFPTVSLGIGGITSIYQARFMKYLRARGLADTEEPQGLGLPRRRRDGRARAMGALGLAGREQLDNLIWVVNCNLQRLDGPVRGNGKIIQELESDFRGAGWNVIKVDMGFALGSAPRRRHRRSLVSGAWRSASTATTRRSNRATAATCASTSSAATRSCSSAWLHMSDDEIWLLNRGGHDQQKVYAAYHAAAPSHGPADRDPGQDDQGLRHGRLRRGPDDHPSGQEDDRGRVAALPRPLRAAADRRPGPGGRVLQAARGFARDAVPARAPRRARRLDAGPPPAPGRAAGGPRAATFKSQLEGTGEREISTTMAFVRMLAALLRDKKIGRHVVPIVPDESRTFGMEGCSASSASTPRSDSSTSPRTPSS